LFIRFFLTYLRDFTPVLAHLIQTPVSLIYVENPVAFLRDKSAVADVPHSIPANIAFGRRNKSFRLWLLRARLRVCG
jgi:hypothetical protein